MVRIFVLGGQQLKFRVPPGRISNYPPRTSAIRERFPAVCKSEGVAPSTAKALELLRTNFCA